MGASLEIICVELVIEAHGNELALLDSDVVFKKSPLPPNSLTNEPGKEYTPILSFIQ